VEEGKGNGFDAPRGRVLFGVAKVEMGQATVEFAKAVEAGIYEAQLGEARSNGANGFLYLLRADRLAMRGKGAISVALRKHTEEWDSVGMVGR
jgi:hypothetical protein